MNAVTDFRFAKIQLASAVSDPTLPGSKEFLWIAAVQQYATGTHFSSIKEQALTQRSIYLGDFSSDAAETISAFKHFVYQYSRGTTVIRNFQGMCIRDFIWYDRH